MQLLFLGSRRPGLGVGEGEGLAVFAFVGEEAWAAELWLPPGNGGTLRCCPNPRAAAAGFTYAMGDWDLA